MVAAGKLYFTFLLVFFFVCRFGRPSQHGVDVDTVEKKKRISDFPPKRSFPVVFPFFYFIFLLKKLLNTKIKNLIFAFLDAVPVHGRMRTAAHIHVGLEYGQNQFRKWYKFKPAFPLYTYYICLETKIRSWLDFTHKMSLCADAIW